MKKTIIILPLIILMTITGINSQQKGKHIMTDKPLEIATLGGGCFWCVEAVFERVEGVHNVVSGYAGGHLKNPTYNDVSTGESGHAEVCQIHFDPTVISYDKILDIFWQAHDPTTLNRQGNDRGTQYRSVIYYHNETQKLSAESAIKTAAQLFKDPLTTEVAPLDDFYKAEVYHQDYFANNPNAPYCTFIIDPKIKKLQNKGTIWND
jgi:peptide-methionine (S)-S-oxide reductase